MSDGRRPGRQGSRAPYPHDLWMVEPRFVNAAAKDFRLLPHSPLLGAGVVLKDVPTLTLFASTATARTFYVNAQTGNNANAGSRAAPWTDLLLL
jgi:hypothetical protein